MRNLSKYLFVILVLLSTSVFGMEQLDLYLVNVRVRVVNIEDGEPVAAALVINPRVRGGTTTNSDGYFHIQMFTEDTLIIRSMGYVDHRFYLTEFPPKELYEIKLKPARYTIGEVTVTDKYRLRENLRLPEAKPLDIPIELRGDGFNEKPIWKAMFINPISYAQYFLSEKEKRKRNTLNVIKDEKQWQTFSVHFNLNTIKRLTNLDDDDADNFMIYCNVNNRLPYFASQMEIEFQIMDFYFKFMKEKKEKEE